MSVFEKIVSWIFEYPTSENLNKSKMEGSEKSFDESTETKKTDNWSSTSMRDETNILNEIFLEQNEVTDTLLCNEEEEGIPFADSDNGSVKLTALDNKDYNIQTVTKKENTDFIPIVQARLSPIGNSSANINLIDDEFIKIHNTDVAAKFNSVSKESNKEFQPPFLKNNTSSEHHTKSHSKSSRNMFIQTEDEGDKVYDDIIIKKSDNSYGISEHQEKNQLFTIPVSSLLSSSEKTSKENIHGIIQNSESFYGALFVVGCSKVLPNHLSEKMNTKYILSKRSEANGLAESNSFLTSDIKESLSTLPAKHVILYSFDNQWSVITFKHDSSSDLFQIGRYEKFPIDFAVDDISPLEKARHGVSRFACRISVQRDQNHEARIYAGAFDPSGVISVGRNCLVHDYCGKMDGFTTNGLLICKPNQNLPCYWREVSVSGYIYPSMPSKMDVSKRPRILRESNILIDGTLIDLCGVTLIWRTFEGLRKTPSEYYLNHLQSTLHKHVPESSLLFRSSTMFVSQVEKAVKKAYVYLSCGHVTGLAFSKPPDNFGKGWSCPSCRVVGPIKELTVGTEPGFYFEEIAPSYAAFRPCGHVATLNTANFWSCVQIPNHRHNKRSICPFCGQDLNCIIKYVKLILPIL